MSVPSEEEVDIIMEDESDVLLRDALCTFEKNLVIEERSIEAIYTILALLNWIRNQLIINN